MTFEKAGVDSLISRNKPVESLLETMKTYPVSLYPFAVHFTRNFNKGFKAGLKLEDELPFVSEERAQRWIDGVKANCERGVLDYELENATISKR